MKRTTKTHPKYPGRIRPAGLGRQEIVEALTEVGEATCTELERLCDMSNPSVNDALRRLRADGQVHVKRWSRVGAKGSFSRVWVLGPGVDAQIRRAGVGDIAAGVATDALGSALAEQMADAAEAELRQWAAGQGRYLTGRYSPGYGDWPITVQPLVAAALDTARRAGLCVTDSNLMTPRKSVTALLGVSDHPVRGHLAGCGHCVLRTRCEYRKRGITCASE